MSRYTLEQSIVTTATEVKAAAVRVLKPLAALNSDIEERFDSIVADLERHLASGDVDNLSLAGQIQNMIQVPLLASDSVLDRYTTYDKYAQVVFGLLPIVTDKTPEAINRTLVVELAIISVIVSLAKVTTTGQLQTRPQTINAAEFLIDRLYSYTEILDGQQIVFSTNRIDRQYFSQLQSYASAAKLIAAAVKYLLLVSFDLRIEKRFTLKTRRAPIEIVITEQGSLGLEDENLDAFIDANQLEGNEIIMLPPGREVVIYV
jgi:hypothetical protein